MTNETFGHKLLAGKAALASGLDTKYIAEVMANCESLLNKGRFAYGEGSDYSLTLKQFREEIFPEVARKLEGKILSFKFVCDPTPQGNASLSIVLPVTGKAIEIYHQYYDTFTPGRSNGNALDYAQESLLYARENLSKLVL